MACNTLPLLNIIVPMMPRKQVFLLVPISLIAYPYSHYDVLTLPSVEAYQYTHWCSYFPVAYTIYPTYIYRSTQIDSRAKSSQSQSLLILCHHFLKVMFLNWKCECHSFLPTMTSISFLASSNCAFAMLHFLPLLELFVHKPWCGWKECEV